MSWVKVKDNKGKIHSVPKSFYLSLIKNMKSFSFVEENQKVEDNVKEKEGVDNGEKIQQYKQTKNNTPRQNSQKIDT